MVLIVEWSYFRLVLIAELYFGVVNSEVVLFWSDLNSGMVLFWSDLSSGVVLFWSGLNSGVLLYNTSDRIAQSINNSITET